MRKGNEHRMSISPDIVGVKQTGIEQYDWKHTIDEKVVDALPSE